jgi:membrane-associated PAP2 superfamily phosphatase
MTFTEGALVVTALLLVATTAAFTLRPETDIQFSALFFDGEAFSWERSAHLQLLRDMNQWLGGLLLALSLALICLPALRSRMGITSRNALVPLVTYVIGVGGIVNLILKETFGRARPRDILEFGGDHQFTSAWEFSNACASNCSFTSGEAAGAAALFSAMFILPVSSTSSRVATGLVIALIAGALSLNRIAFGAHFLSDVLLSIFIVFAISLAAKVILDRMAEWTASAELSSRSARTNLQHEQTLRADARTLSLNSAGTTSA